MNSKLSGNRMGLKLRLNAQIGTISNDYTLLYTSGPPADKA